MAQIIQFPARHSSAYENLRQLVGITDDIVSLEMYAEATAACNEAGYFFPGELDDIKEQLRTKRLKLAEPEKKPAAKVNGPGLYMYTPEMGEQKPSCQIEAMRSYYGKHFHLYTPLDLKGKGITLDGVLEEKNLNASGKYRAGWFEYTVTARAFEKLQEKYSISQERLLD